MSSLTKERALAFLREHQPMPDLGEVDASVFYEWDDVCQYFIDHPCIEAIPLLISALAGESTFEGFQLIPRVAAKLPVEEIEPIYIQALRSPSISVRSWVAEFASYLDTSNTELYEALLNRIEDSTEDADVRQTSAASVMEIGQKGFMDWRPYKDRIEAIISKEENEEIIELLNILLNGYDPALEKIFEEIRLR